LTRPIARKRARALFDLCAGFVYTQVLLFCVRLGVFEILRVGPQSAESLAIRLNVPAESADILLDAAVSLKLLSRRQGRYALGELGVALIGNPGLVAMIEHHALVYGDLDDPVALLRGQRRQDGLHRYWSYADGSVPQDDSQISPYTQLMSASQPFVAEEILAAIRFDRYRCLLDVGGGDGTFVEAVARATPGLRVMAFDLPPVADRARLRFERAGLTQASGHGGDAKTGPLPAGADLISFVRVIHDHDDDSVCAMLRQARAALLPGGTLMIAEPMSGTPGAEPIGDAYFGFYLMAMGRGRSRTPEAIETLLAQSGFMRPRRVATRLPVMARIILAEPDPSFQARGMSRELDVRLD
jgi:demethylspheroidene O-methyltransferase